MLVKCFFPNYLKDKWEKSGMLEGVPEEHQTRLSIAFENAAEHLIMNNGKYDAGMESLVFPVIYRIFLISNFKEINENHVIRVFNDVYRLCGENFSSLRYFSNMDAEAELCRFFSEYYHSVYLSGKRHVVVEKSSNIKNSIRKFAKENSWVLDYDGTLLFM